MNTKKLYLYFLIPYIIFIVTGFLLANSFEYIESHKAIDLALKWLGVPCFMTGFYYAYSSIFSYGPQQAVWRKIIGLIIVSVLFTGFQLISFSGYLTYYNSKIGNQRNQLIQGRISKLRFPAKKKALNNYSIEVRLDESMETIFLDVPTKNYFVGQHFEKTMTLGSLGILYSYE